MRAMLPHLPRSPFASRLKQFGATARTVLAVLSLSAAGLVGIEPLAELQPGAVAFFDTETGSDWVIPDFKAAGMLVRHYLKEVHPYIGHYSKDPGQPYNITVIASQTLAIYGQLPPQDKDLVPAVMATLIGPKFDPTKQTNGTLMYNLACHYAVTGDKPHMLESITAARRLGKRQEQFMADSDFEKYWKDAEFLKVLAETQPQN